MTRTQAPLAVSIGDPCGIGPDIILKAWCENQNALPSFFVIGSVSVLEKRAAELGIVVRFADAFDSSSDGNHLLVHDLAINSLASPANPKIEDAQLAIKAIERGVELVFENRASALVTCPINKKVLYQAGFIHPGHTEFLATLAAKHSLEPDTTPMPVMMLAGPELRTVPVTIHIPLQEVSPTLTTGLIIQTCEIVAHDLKLRFGVQSPRLALAGLNPHAGENGALGSEDREVILPAIQTLAAKGLDVRGPLPADTMFHKQARETYDAAICMYHDQALVPAKMLGFDDAVNVTLGLPFVRTSPDHGTAYDIAGTGKANPSSFMAALAMAAEMVFSK